MGKTQERLKRKHIGHACLYQRDKSQTFPAAIVEEVRSRSAVLIFVDEYDLCNIVAKEGEPLDVLGKQGELPIYSTNTIERIPPQYQPYYLDQLLMHKEIFQKHGYTLEDNL